MWSEIIVLLMYRAIKGYCYSAASMVILVIIFGYLQETYFTVNTGYLPLLIALSISTTIFAFLGYKNLKNDRYQKLVGFLQAIFLVITLTAAVYLMQLHTLTNFDRGLTIVIFMILTITLIISIRNISYEGEKKIIPLDYGDEA